MILLKIKNLSYRFKGEQSDVLRGVSLDIRPGEILGLIGPDGAGKTTLMRNIAGVLSPTEGVISVREDSSSQGLTDFRKKIGYMTQRFSLYEDLTIDDNMKLYASLHGISETDAAEQGKMLLRKAGLERFTDRLAGKLSGGMKQKLALICAMYGNPELMLLDEPGVGVDPLSRRELWGLVEQASQDGCAIVWSTAYLDEAARCQRVCIMHEGKIRYLGHPDGILEGLKGRVFALRSEPEKRIFTLANIQAQDHVEDAMIRGSDIRFILNGMPQENDLPEGSRAVDPNFEEAFINLIGIKIKRRKSPPPPSLNRDTKDIVIRTEGLTRRFGAFTATDHLSIQVHRGEIFGLLGSNGAGKTTAFRMMCGLLPPTEGIADILGIDLKRDAARARSHIGYMAQKFSLYANLSVIQNLRFFASIYGLKGNLRKERLDESIHRFDLQPWIKHTSGTLTPGIRQRLSMACATLHHPEFLFLDEPTSGVDPFTRREFWEEINSMSAAGVTIIVTTHFMDEAQYLHRMVIMDKGRVIAEGSPEELKALAVSSGCPEPEMEDAFIHFILKQEQQHL